MACDARQFAGAACGACLAESRLVAFVVPLVRGEGCVLLAISAARAKLLRRGLCAGGADSRLITQVLLRRPPVASS
eukprot:13239797-Heterocapsa_arctica.AAC.1